MDELSLLPECPIDRSCIPSPDDNLMGIAEELRERAFVLCEHVAEGRIQNAHVSLYEALQSAGVLMTGLPHFAKLTACDDLGLSWSENQEACTYPAVPLPTFETILALRASGNYHEAYGALSEIILVACDLLPAFRFDVESLSSSQA